MEQRGLCGSTCLLMVNENRQKKTRVVFFNFTAADHFEQHTPVPFKGNSQARVPMKAVTLFVWIVSQMLKSYWNNGSMTFAANHKFKLL